MSWTLFGLLARAAETTAALSAASIGLGIALGILVCGAGLSSHALLRLPARVYVSAFRGVPLLVQLLLLYYLLPGLGLNVSSVQAAILALTLCTSAYQAENLRGGFLSVPPGLLEAGEMVGMTAWQRFRRISAPVAVRLTVPAMINEAIAILHASALVSVVGVVELTKTAQNLSASTFAPLPIYAASGLLYLALTAVLGGAGLLAERRLRVRHAS